MSENEVITDPARRTRIFILWTVTGTVLAGVILSLFTSPILYAAIKSGPIVAGYAVLAVTGWSIYLGQEIAFGDLGNQFKEFQDQNELPWTLQSAITILSLTYYNVVLLTSVVASSWLASQSLFLVAALFALAYPAYEIWVIKVGVPASIGGVLAIAIAIVVGIIQGMENIDWQSIDLEQPVVQLANRSRESI